MFLSCTQGEESMKKIMLIAPIIYEFRASWVSSVGTNLSGFSSKSHTLFPQQPHTEVVVPSLVLPGPAAVPWISLL